ncbi:hypothetical protein BD779DRAFT_1613471 [Infundibulicybe gibba]|nr:hypothetical protein BD779DRAFT_1613471 [Infundibulicybe gibba]
MTQSPLFRAPFNPQNLPFDILPPILVQLGDRRDWHACALVSKVFNRVATPLLYRTLDSRIISKSLLFHPSSTLIQKPELARHVRHVTETGAVHRGLLPRFPRITHDALAALALCTSLHSMTWIDDFSTTDSTLLSFLAVLSKLPLRELTIRTHSDLGETVWSQLTTLTGLHKISIWCMEGPPRVLQGWSEKLGSTLTHLELGRCAGVPPTILITVLAHLPLLKDLRLKGAPASSIPTILAFLPNLFRWTRITCLLGHLVLAPALRRLTVRTSSMDTLGPQKLWGWIQDLTPKPGLEEFKLHAFTINMGHTSVPRMFILDMAMVHGATLKHFMVGEAQLTLGDVECLCIKFRKLETIVCSIASPDVGSIANAIKDAENLRTLKLQVQWIPKKEGGSQFTLEHAREMMMASRKDGEQSKLRVIGVGFVLYTGRWVLREGIRENMVFEVMEDVAEDRWKT